MDEWMSQYMEAGGRAACVEILRCGHDYYGGVVGGMNEWVSQYMEAGGRTACVEILRCGHD